MIDRFIDEDLMRMFDLTKVQVYKLRKGTVTVTPEMERDMAGALVIREEEAKPKPDPNNPDFTHPGFQQYEVSFRAAAKEHGLIPAYQRWTDAIECGCMGPQGDMPFCPCQMRGLTAERFVSLVPTPEGEAL